MPTTTGPGIAAGLLIAMFSSSVLGAGSIFDGSKTLICAPNHIVACIGGSDCLRGEPAVFDFPEFVVLDMATKVLRATEHSAIKELSPIKNLEESEDHTILQGVEAGRGWSISIAHDTGQMSAVVSGGGVSFMVFGPCTAL